MPLNLVFYLQIQICKHVSLDIWWKHNGLSVSEWIKKLWHIYTMEYYAAERKKKLLPFVTAWIELESIILSEICQAVQEKYRMVSAINES